ncbi:743_t:CDS:2, partial [Cetraspora pellucida]
SKNFYKDVEANINLDQKPKNQNYSLFREFTYFGKIENADEQAYKAYYKQTIKVGLYNKLKTNANLTSEVKNNEYKKRMQSSIETSKHTENKSLDKGQKFSTKTKEIELQLDSIQT